MLGGGRRVRFHDECTSSCIKTGPHLLRGPDFKPSFLIVVDGRRRFVGNPHAKSADFC
jgi:hypothetical protein